MICGERYGVVGTLILWIGCIIPLLMGATAAGQFKENPWKELRDPSVGASANQVSPSLHQISRSRSLQPVSNPRHVASTSKLRITSSTKQLPNVARVDPTRARKVSSAISTRADATTKRTVSIPQAVPGKKVASPFWVTPSNSTPVNQMSQGITAMQKSTIAVATNTSPSPSRPKRLARTTRTPPVQRRNPTSKIPSPKKLGIKYFAEASLHERTLTAKAARVTLQTRQQKSKNQVSEKRVSSKKRNGDQGSIQGENQRDQKASKVFQRGYARQQMARPPVEKFIPVTQALSVQQPISVQLGTSPKVNSSGRSSVKTRVKHAVINTSANLPSPIGLPMPLTASPIPGFDNSSTTNSKIVFRPAVSSRDKHGRLILRPRVKLAGAEYDEEVLPTPAFKSAPAQVYIAPETFQEQLPELPTSFGSSAGVACGDFVNDYAGAFACEVSWCQEMNGCCKAGLYNLFGACPSQDIGIGRSRLPFAPFFIERSQPLPNHVGFRLDAGWDYDTPGRSNYFLAQRGAGGLAPSNIDFQEFRLSFELGSKKFSTITELPIRGVDPGNVGIPNDAESGFGDMAIGTKLVMLDGKTWQITQLFRTTFNTGDVNKSLGAGHVALEPGIAYRIKLTEDSFFYGDVKLNIPVGGDPELAGDVANYGIGISRVYIDADDFAILPTLELVAWSFLDGRGSDPEIDVANLYPGVRIVCDRGGDIPIWELGIATGFPITSSQLYSNILRIDLRWNF